MSNNMTRNRNAPTALWLMTLTMVPILALLLPIVPPAHAHGVYIFAWAEGDTVYTDSYFSSKKKVKDGLVKVFNSSGDLLLEGKTNDNGEFSFKIPGNGSLLLVLEAGTGHGAEFLLEDDEITGLEESPAPPQASDGPHGPPPAPSQEDLDRIRTVVEETLDERLKPITRALAKLQQNQGPELTEIIGGIGYIIGIMGLVLYFRNKKKS